MLYEWGLGDRVSCTDAEKKACEKLIQELIALAAKVHDQGLLALEDDIKKMPKGYLRTLTPHLTSPLLKSQWVSINPL